MTRDVVRSTVDSILQGVTCRAISDSPDEDRALELVFPADTSPERINAARQLHLIVKYRTRDGREISNPQQWLGVPNHFELFQKDDHLIIRLKGVRGRLLHASFLLPRLKEEVEANPDAEVVRRPAVHYYFDKLRRRKS